MRWLWPTILAISSGTLAGCERLAWDGARGETGGTVGDYERYLSKYPHGTYSQVARFRIDSLHYVAAGEEYTVAAYERYLTQHPDGVYIKHAQKKLGKVVKIVVRDGVKEKELPFQRIVALMVKSVGCLPDSGSTIPPYGVLNVEAHGGELSGRYTTIPGKYVTLETGAEISVAVSFKGGGTTAFEKSVKKGRAPSYRSSDMYTIWEAFDDTYPQVMIEMIDTVFGRDAIVSGLLDEAFAVRLASLEVLKWLRDEKATDIIVGMLATKNGEERLAAIEALGEIRDIRALDPLVTTLRDGNKEENLAAIYALKGLGSLRAVEALRSVRLGSMDEERAAKYAIEEISQQKHPPEAMREPRWAGFRVGH